METTHGPRLAEHEPADFSLVVGGPLYDFYVRTHLEAPAVGFAHRRILAALALTWAPLWLLIAVDPRPITTVVSSLATDIDGQVRFLIALPLLIAAEPVVHDRLTAVVRQFVTRGLISEHSMSRFAALVRSSRRLAGSTALDVLALMLTVAGGKYLWDQQVTLRVDSWFGMRMSDGVVHLTPAGWWFTLVSLPLFRFLLVRWYLRIIVVWYRFMWCVARLPLRLNALHPDRTGGLGFITTSAFAFIPVLLAQTVQLAARIAQLIWFQGTSLRSFERDIAAVMGVLLVLVFLPQTFFAVRLERTWRKGLSEYGLLACDYVDRFRQKWLGRHLSASPSPLGTADIQSLADLGSAFDVMLGMTFVPISRSVVIRTAFVIALPLVPLAFTVIPLHDFLTHLIRLVI